MNTLFTFEDATFWKCTSPVELAIWELRAGKLLSACFLFTPLSIFVCGRVSGLPER